MTENEHSKQKQAYRFGIAANAMRCAALDSRKRRAVYVDQWMCLAQKTVACCCLSYDPKWTETLYGDGQ